MDNDKVQNQKLQSLGLLAAAMGHRFNNLLMGIQGNAEMTLWELPEDSPLRENQTDIQDASRQAAAICKQVLAYARENLESPAGASLATTIAQVEELLRVCVARHTALELELPETMPPTEIPAQHLVQVLINLVTNANAAIDELNGRIAIRCGIQQEAPPDDFQWQAPPPAPGQATTYLEVEDSGRGMDPESLARAFEEGYSSLGPGRGMGLPVVLEIVRKYGGSVGVQSAPGAGTRVRVLLP